MFDFLKKVKNNNVSAPAAQNGFISSEWFYTTIADLSDGVVAYDTNFKIVIFNKSAERIFNLKALEVIGQNISLDRVRESKLKFLAQVIFPSLAPNVVLHSDPNTFPQMMDMHFEEVHLRVITNKIIDSNGQTEGFTKVIHDRTREINIVKSKSEFLSVAAHQLRTPLTAINWSLEGLLSDTSLAAFSRELVDAGTSAAKRLLKIVDDLLDVAKLEEGKFGYTFAEGDFNSFMEKLLAEETPIAQTYGVNLYFERLKEELKFSFDEQKLALAISNLVDNAIKYNVPNGSVTVSISKAAEGPYVLVSVKDTGLGIPKDAIDKLFTKFFRAENAVKASTEGSGLGLYLVKNVIQRHGGKIWVESEINRGTTFYFTLATDPAFIPHKETAPEEGF